MSTKLSISLNKLEALVLSVASRTTAKGDDASVVKVFERFQKCDMARCHTTTNVGGKLTSD